jgi:hypothetical protein
VSALSLLDAIERPAILGPPRDERAAAGRTTLREALDSAPARDVAPADRAPRQTGDAPVPRASDGATRRIQDTRADGGPTLDEVIVRVWEGLAVTRSAPCPICSGPLIPRFGAAGPGPVAGGCRDCGSELS